jgi:cation diffusion facilitator family transporter
VGHSPALLADGINSASDVAYGIVVSVFMRLSGKPADEEHPYGHYQLESIAAVVVGAFVITTAISIYWVAVTNIYELWSGVSDFGGASSLALWVALITVIMKIWLTIWTNKVAAKTNNSAVVVLAADHKNDIFAALAASIGIYLGRMGYHWVDPLAGAVVSLIILQTGLEIIKDSAADLMDTLPGKKLKTDIAEHVENIKEVKELEEVHVNKFGPYMVTNIKIGVDSKISVAEGDRIATEVEDVLLDQVEFMRRVYVHDHPVNGSQTG